MRQSINNASIKRNCGLDAAKAFACMAVIVIHLIGKNSSPFNGCLFFLAGVAVPIFFMANGYFLLNKKSLGYRYVFSKVGSILSVVALWSALIWALKCVSSKVLLNPLDLFFGALLGMSGWLSWFWFLGALILLQLIAPLVWRVNKVSVRVQLALAFGVAVFCFGIHTLDLMQAAHGGQGVLAVPEALRIWTWLDYFLWGGVIGNPALSKAAAVILTRRWTEIGILVAATLLLLWQYVVGFCNLDIEWIEHYYDDPLTVILSAALLFWFDSYLPVRVSSLFHPGAIEVQHGNLHYTSILLAGYCALLCIHESIRKHCDCLYDYNCKL